MRGEASRNRETHPGRDFDNIVTGGKIFASLRGIMTPVLSIVPSTSLIFRIPPPTAPGWRGSRHFRRNPRWNDAVRLHAARGAETGEDDADPIALDQPTPDLVFSPTRTIPRGPRDHRQAAAPEPALGAIIVNNKISNVCAPGGEAAAERVCPRPRACSDSPRRKSGRVRRA